MLIRHAENDWVHAGKLAGWTPGVHLNEEGTRQAEALGKRLASAKLKALYSSPLERAVETAQAILKCHPELTLQLEDDIGEAQYGQWTGQRIRKLARTRLWQIIQVQPSRAQFPGGESIREMQARAVGAIERLAVAHPEGTVAVVSHADVIKSLIAHYAGMHLDLFQRLVIAPASISIVNLHKYGPTIVRVNDVSHCEQQNNDKGGKD